MYKKNLPSTGTIYVRYDTRHLCADSLDPRSTGRASGESLLVYTRRAQTWLPHQRCLGDQPTRVIEGHSHGSNDREGAHSSAGGSASCQP